MCPLCAAGSWPNAAGCRPTKAAIHAMRAVFDSQAILQVDATNTFNCLNRYVALRNISTICPYFTRILINMYCVDSLLYIDGDSGRHNSGGSLGYANVCS